MFERRFDSISVKYASIKGASSYPRLNRQQQPAYSRAIALKYILKLTYSHYNSVNRNCQVKSEKKSKYQSFFNNRKEIEKKNTDQIINIHKEKSNDSS
jgi:hypothetical protein